MPWLSQTNSETSKGTNRLRWLVWQMTGNERKWAIVFQASSQVHRLKFLRQVQRYCILSRYCRWAYAASSEQAWGLYVYSYWQSPKICWPKRGFDPVAIFHSVHCWILYVWFPELLERHKHQIHSHGSTRCTPDPSYGIRSRNAWFWAAIFTICPMLISDRSQAFVPKLVFRSWPPSADPRSVHPVRPSIRSCSAFSPSSLAPHSDSSPDPSSYSLQQPRSHPWHRRLQTFRHPAALATQDHPNHWAYSRNTAAVNRAQTRKWEWKVWVCCWAA